MANSDKQKWGTLIVVVYHMLCGGFRYMTVMHLEPNDGYIYLMTGYISHGTYQTYGLDVIGTECYTLRLPYLQAEFSQFKK